MLFLLVILSSDLRRNIPCIKIEKQRDRRGSLCLSDKWLEKWKTSILIFCHSKTVFLTSQKLHGTWNFSSQTFLLFRVSVITPKWPRFESELWPISSCIFKADFLRKLLLYAPSGTHSFRNHFPGTLCELDQKINRSCDSMTAANTGTQDVFELPSGLSFWGNVVPFMKIFR